MPLCPLSQHLRDASHSREPLRAPLPAPGTTGRGVRGRRRRWPRTIWVTWGKMHPPAHHVKRRTRSWQRQFYGRWRRCRDHVTMSTKALSPSSSWVMGGGGCPKGARPGLSVRSEPGASVPRQAQAGAHVRQEGQAGDPLHGEDEEGDHGQAAARRPPLDLPEGVSEGGVAAPAGTGGGGSEPGGGCEQAVPPPAPAAAHVSFCRARCW